MFDSFFNSIFGFLIDWSPLVSLLVISLLLTLLISLSYKFLTNQKEMKEHKDEISKLQKEMKSLKNSPKEMMEKQKILMERNMKMMKHNFKPMLFTFIPLIIIFGWLSSTLAYEPLEPNMEFPVDITFNENANNEIVKLESDTLNIENNEQIIKEGKARWIIKGEEGKHRITIVYKSEQYPKDISITKKWMPSKPEDIKNSDLKRIEVGNKFKPLLGLSWFWIYLISAVIFSMIIRKVLKIY
ncbi:DUF106 domain-containing protein [Candidatus Woesearchaeota archaeon]|nr:DUF106 domain-containing protein [Candidatus Woesearchaeota archaeon]